MIQPNPKTREEWDSYEPPLAKRRPRSASKPSQNGKNGKHNTILDNIVRTDTNQSKTKDEFVLVKGFEHYTENPNQLKLF